MAAPASSPVEFLFRRPQPRLRRRPPLAGAFFLPTGLSGAPLLRALASLAEDLLGTPPPPSQRRNLDFLHARCRRRAPAHYHDPVEVTLGDRRLAVLRHFELGQPPDPSMLRSLLQIGISDTPSCRSKIEYLEEQILSQEEDANLPLIGGVVALLWKDDTQRIAFAPPTKLAGICEKICRFS